MNYQKNFLCTGLLLLLSGGLWIYGDELSVGKPAPDFSFMTAEGNAQRLSSYRGKPVALHFWATWCGPCVRELPLISALTTTRAQDLTVLAVNCAETPGEVARFLGRAKLHLNVVMDEDYRIAQLYRINAIPQTYLIDGVGIIRSIRVGAYSRGELNRDISALLN